MHVDLICLDHSLSEILVSPWYHLWGRRAFSWLPVGHGRCG